MPGFSKWGTLEEKQICPILRFTGKLCPWHPQVPELRLYKSDAFQNPARALPQESVPKDSTSAIIAFTCVVWRCGH